MRVFRERPGFVEAEVRQGTDAVLLQWARDSAYRCYPLITHPEFGLTLQFLGGVDLLRQAVASGGLLYHAGSFRGAFPTPA